MKKLFLTAVAAFILSSSNAQTDVNLGIIPAPVAIQKGSGTFAFDKTVVILSANPKNAKIAETLKSFAATKGLNLRVVQTLAAGQKAIEITSVGADQLPSEGYQIKVSANKIKLIGKDAGLFYALQSLMQLTPDKSTDGKIHIPNVEINDYPRFSYRGLHLDVGRHFFPMSFLKKYIDVMAAYKLNNFHWHLTEDQGWRLEIKKYPKLTEVGASRNGTIIGNYPGSGGTDNEVYKGYYTQAEAKEIVAYAAARYINVIPEIELPGHASAAIAAYPELSVFPDRDTYIGKDWPWSGSRTGKQVQQTWGVFDDIFVPSENTFKFLENVLDEVIAIFPSKYIHIGGDEAPKKYWKESEFCQQLIKEKGLKDEHELQSYFIQRIEKYLNGKGRSIIGWDEILEGGLAPNATVMSWRGEKGGIEAAQQNHDVLMTPSTNGLYFDHKQSVAEDEPLTIGRKGKGFAHYSKVYNYDPVPAVLTEDQKKYIKGVQANLWTEYIETPAKAEYMLFPRVYALAEIAWTPLNRKDIKNFSEERLSLHLAKLDKTNTNYWVPPAVGQPDKAVNGENHVVELKSPITGAKIYYTLDGYRPSENAAEYNAPLKINVPQGQQKVLKTIVITPSGKRSIVAETVFNNGAVEAKVK
ncbi:MAG: family 20 glycosylhydrolase [Pedobacter sp.]|uniref:beta-N-acetylhexosaminidase n=1 Tax=Pedobacter sp. TaxID=1411316 RepID=UPI0028084E05|nr:family 20 glycosylhydrolase [Pedobacter sp.]MDQ8003315.1 family 20 glycosylhydrolase [Pedobacter sp.]